MKLRLLLLSLLTALSLTTAAQTLDPAFAPTVLKQTGGFFVRAMLKQPDGKIVIGGATDFVDGVLTNRVRRLNADGSPDAAFLAQTGAGMDGGTVWALALQPDGKILVGAVNMTHYDGVYAGGLARLNADGSVDATFNVGGVGFPNSRVNRNTYVQSLAVQADGKILVGLNSDSPASRTYNGQPVSGLIRLNPNGQLDSSFNIGSGVNFGGGLYIGAILVQADGKIVIGGQFDSINGSPVNNLARLNSDGSLDTSFNVGTGPSRSVRAIVQQPDGKLLVGGFFSHYNQVAVQNPIRLNTNGSLDPTFQGGVAVLPNNTSVGVMRLNMEASGNLLIAGIFTRYSGATVGGVAKVSSTGTLDASFVSGTGITTGFTYDLLPIAAGKYLVGGSFTDYSGVPRTGLARLNSNASLDLSYNPVQEIKGYITALAPLANGELLVDGYFTNFNGTSITPGIHRLNPDGTYNSHIVASGASSWIVMLSDGQLFTHNYNFTPPASSTTFSRLLNNGGPDPGFAPVNVADGTNPGQFRLAPASNGALYLYGSFTSVNGTARAGLARVLANGSLDAAFMPANAIPAGAYIYQVIPMAGGKVLVVWDDNTANHLTMLTATGSPDPSFNSGGSAGYNFFIWATHANGHLVITGDFTSFNGLPAPYGIVRLLPSGSIDPNFNAALPLTRVYVQSDGRILGCLNEFLPTQQLRRLNADGSIDTSFPAVAIPESINSSSYLSYTLQPSDGKILLFGEFTRVAGQQRIGLARLTNTLLATRPALAAAPEFDVFPNPAQNQVTLRLPVAAASAITQSVELLDMQGRTVRRFTLPARQTEATFSVTDVAAGVYLLQTTTAQGPSRQRVVITQ